MRPEAEFVFGANFGTPFGSGSQLIFFYKNSKHSSNENKTKPAKRNNSERSNVALDLSIDFSLI
jgi:hypothetical protein